METKQWTEIPSAKGCGRRWSAWVLLPRLGQACAEQNVPSGSSAILSLSKAGTNSNEICSRSSTSGFLLSKAAAPPWLRWMVGSYCTAPSYTLHKILIREPETRWAKITWLKPALGKTFHYELIVKVCTTLPSPAKSRNFTDDFE